VTLGDSALRLSERAKCVVQTSRRIGNVRTDPSGIEVTERLQTIEGALHVPLNALERLAPNEHAPERYRRWLDALTAVHVEVLDDFLALTTGHGRPE
jgi:hypothetical protein